MPSARYALVAYLRSQVGDFVDNLRRELHPALPHLPAHITLLPPRPLQGTESAALDIVAQTCAQTDPFELVLGEVDSFAPSTPTVYIQVAHAARLLELHDRLNTQILAFDEEWPYIPHVTVVKMPTEQEAAEALQIARERWKHYPGARRILLDRLVFVREEKPNCWIDLAPIPLGGQLVSK
jgi:2'-5' RNA ligase